MTFDQLLQPGLLAHGNWEARHAAKMYAPAAPAVAAGAAVTVPMVLNFADLGPDVVNYTAAIPDVVGLASGVPAPAFADFPIT